MESQIPGSRRSSDICQGQTSGPRLKYHADDQSSRSAGQKGRQPMSDTQRPHALELHHQAIVIDAHSDILSALADNRMRLKDRVSVEPPDTWQGAKFVKMPAQTTPYDPSPYSVWFECMGQYDIPRFPGRLHQIWSSNVSRKVRSSPALKRLVRMLPLDVSFLMMLSASCRRIAML
jgi:hypothetical protein